MKTNYFFLKSLFLAVGMLVAMTFVSCSSDDDNYSYTPGPDPSEELAIQDGESVSRRAGSAPEPMLVATKEDIGKLICTDGHIHADGADAECTAKRVAKIIYIGTTGHYIYNHGLALALKDASTGAAWCSQDEKICLGSYGTENAAKSDMAGIANTDALVGHCSHTHAAASAARNYLNGAHPTGTSEWFLPSVGQWQKMVDAAGGCSALKRNTDLQSASYWSSTQYNNRFAWNFRPGPGDWDKGLKSAAGPSVRAALAF